MFTFLKISAKYNTKPTPFSQGFSNVSNKKGVATIVSLMFVTLAILFSVSFFKLLSSSVDGQKKEFAIVQKNLLYLDSLTMLKNSKMILGGAYTPKEYIERFDKLSISKEGIKIDVNLSSAHSKLNFNNYRDQNKSDKAFEGFFKNLLANYGVANIDFFWELLEASKTDEANATKPFGKISLYEPNFQNGAFEGYPHFKGVLDYYKKVTKDESPYKIPWQELFIFAPQGVAEFVDCEFTSPLLSSEIYRQFGVFANDCKEDGAQKFKIKKGDSKENYYILVGITFDADGAKEKIKYYYDLKSERAYIIE